jgi:hypothetical protein
MPLNMPSHVHSNGYADVNFLILELFSTLDVRINKLPEAFLSASGGSFAWGRLTLAPVWVASGGVRIGESTGWFGELRYRYFGARPLTEDGVIKSPATGTLNARIGYRFDNGSRVTPEAAPASRIAISSG